MTRRLRELTLWAGAALGLLAVAAGLAVAFFGFNLLVFRSGSMSPEIPTGGLALARSVPAAELAKGDVVSVTTAGGDRVTHRIVSSALRGDEASLVLQGDANSVPDSEVYEVTSADRVVASMPWGGYVLVHALTPPGLVAAGAVGLMLVVIGFGSSAPTAASAPAAPSSTRRNARHRASSTRSGVAVAVTASVVLTCAAVGIGGGVTRTWATFTDQATLKTGNFSSGSIAEPALPSLTQTTGTGTAAISWTPTAVANVTATSYDVIRYAAATGGTGTVVCNDVANPLTCTEPKPPTAAANTTYHYAIQANYPANWTRESPTRRPYTPDVVAPSLGLTQPRTPGVSASNMRGQVANCPSTGIACGTASDSSGVATVQYTLRRVLSLIGLGLVTQCWSGTQWVTTGAAACTNFAATNGTATWVVPGNPSTAYPGGLTTANLTLNLRATDVFGNVANGSVDYSVTGTG